MLRDMTKQLLKKIKYLVTSSHIHTYNVYYQHTHTHNKLYTVFFYIFCGNVS